MSLGLTPKQAALLEFVRTYIPAHNGIAPSYKEMAVEISSHKSSVCRLLRALEERGFIRHLRYRARSIEILPPDESLVDLETELNLMTYCRRGGFKPQSVVAIALTEYFRANPLTDGKQ